MAESSSSRPRTSSEFREHVAETLIDMLEKGVAPWQQPWTDSASTLPFNPVSALTGTHAGRYRGGNFLYLQAVQLLSGYSDSRWVTFLQASRMKADTMTPLTQAEIDHNKHLPLAHPDRIPTWRIRKGEHGTMIEKWGVWTPKAPDPYSAAALESSDDAAPKSRLFFRGFVVFNASQIDGIPALEQPEMKWTPDDRFANAKAVVDRLGVPIVTGSAARYFPKFDRIEMPAQQQFQNEQGYYATLLHECAHATGHESRLNRPGIIGRHDFASPEYAKEELRVEIASMVLASETGIPNDPTQNAAYVASWLKALRGDPSEIFRAAKDASRISDFLLGYDLDLALKPTTEPVLRAPELRSPALAMGSL